jgi:4-hydroxyacetophenone monooxygenase
MNITEQCRLAVQNPVQLDKAIAACDPVPLLMSLVHMTGETEWLDKAAPYIKGGWSYLVSMPDELAEAIRTKLRETVHAVAEGAIEAARPDGEMLTKMMNTAVGQKVPDDYQPIFYEETQLDGHDPKDVPWRKAMAPEQLDRYNVLVIGAGFSGIGMGIKLSQAGIPYTILEKNQDVGGTWYENQYPGIAVDTPNHFYCYSFAPNPTWSRYFAPGAEIQNYILDCVERFGIRNKVQFGQEDTRAQYDEHHALWRVSITSSSGSRVVEAKVLISAVGALNRPSIPNIPGLETFAGPAFHTAHWDKSLSLKGKRVAMIGTGASGIQVGPVIAPIVDQLTIFQRSAPWIINHPLYHQDLGLDVRWAMAHIPYYMRWFRFMLFWAASDGFHPTLQMDPEWTKPAQSLNADNDRMRSDLIAYYESKVGHRPDLLAKVIPDYPPFGKRMLRDTKWFDMLLRPNVELETGGIECIESDAVVMQDGTRHAADVIVLATGFQAAKMISPMEVVGRGGTTLRDLWGEDDPRAYLGITHPGFPNFFMVYGPNTNLAHGGSAVFHSECQIHYIMEALRELIETGADAMECRTEPFETYNHQVDAALKKMVWSHPGVTNWYKNKKGRVIMNSPWRLATYRHLTAHVEPADYEFTRAEKT